VWDTLRRGLPAPSVKVLDLSLRKQVESARLGAREPVRGPETEFALVKVYNVDKDLSRHPQQWVLRMILRVHEELHQHLQGNLQRLGIRHLVLLGIHQRLQLVSTTWS